jgi:hypothetical protein
MDNPHSYQSERSVKERKRSPSPGFLRHDTADAQVYWGTGRNDGVTGGNKKAQRDLHGERVNIRDYGSQYSYLHSPSPSSYGRSRESKDNRRRR